MTVTASSEVQKLMEKINYSSFSQNTNFEKEVEKIFDNNMEKKIDVHLKCGRKKIFTLHFRWQIEKGWNLGEVTHHIDLANIREEINL